jgi:hypothetical protein
MDEFEKVYGDFGVWRIRFNPAKFTQAFGTDPGPLVLVPLEHVVERFVSENKSYQKYKDQILKRWEDERKEDSVTDANNQYVDSEWNR